MGFYYCKWCYPALFKNTSAPEYEIPIDEKGLMKIESEINFEVKKNATTFKHNTFKHKIEKTLSKIDKLKCILYNLLKNIIYVIIIVVILSLIPNIYDVNIIIGVFVIMAILRKYMLYDIFKNIMYSLLIAIIWSVLADIYYVTMHGRDSANFGFYIMGIFVIMAILSIVFSIIQICLYIYREEEADIKIYIMCCIIILFIFNLIAM